MPNNDTFAIAFKFHTLGRAVIPSGGGDSGKAALVKWQEYQQKPPTDDDLFNWERNLQPKIWAMVTGAVSGVFALDADKPEAIEFMRKAGIKPHVNTPKGEHYYCKHPGYPIKNAVGIIPGLDVRGDGGYVNFAGGNGNANYQVVQIPTEDNLYKIDQLPPKVWGFLTDTKRRARTKAKAEKLLEGNRNSTLASVAGSMRRRGMPQAAIEVALLEVNRTQCDPPLEDQEVLTIAQSISRYEPAAGSLDDKPDTEGYHLTDLGNAHRFADQHRRKVLYSHEMKSWLIYIGGRWVKDRKGLVHKLAKRTTLSWYIDVSNESDDTRRKELRQHAVASERDQRITAMLNLAQSELGIPITVDELDNNPWLFNCRNGTIDLHTGQLLPHNPEDLLMQQAPVEYDPEAIPTEWHKFLDTVTGGDKEVITLLKRAVGMSLTGDVRVQALFFLYGTGCNGKSTFLATLRKLFGSYGLKANMTLFTIKTKGDSGPTESLANLRGKRFVMATEIEEGKRLAVATIKDMTSGEPLRADRKYEHEIEFDPTFKLWLSGNHKPVITDTTYSIWRRFKLIPFTVKIENPREDHHLKLEAELPGILNWAIDGCLEWQREGLGQAQAVKTATEEYRREQDMLADFLADCCVLDPQACVTKGELFEAYQKWCQTNARVDLGKRKFGERLIEKGVIGTRGNRNVAIWGGIRLLEEDEDVTFVTQLTENPETLSLMRVNTKSSLDLNNKGNKSNTDNPSWPAYADLLGKPVEEVISIWESQGTPGIELAPGNMCVDLAKLFSHEDIPIDHLLQIKNWLDGLEG